MVFGFYIQRIVIERRQGAHDSYHNRHRVGVTTKALKKLVSWSCTIVCSVIVPSNSCISALLGQLAVQQ